MATSRCTRCSPSPRTSTRRPRVVFDLDPGEPATILDAAEIAVVLRGVVNGVGLESFAKSSGSKGVQVNAPFNGDATFGAVCQFGAQRCRRHRRTPGGRVIGDMSRRLRTGKVLIDWAENDRHKSTVAAYSLRAKLPRRTVSAPLKLGQLAAAVDAGSRQRCGPPRAEVLDRVAALGDPFAPVLSLRKVRTARTGYARRPRIRSEGRRPTAGSTGTRVSLGRNRSTARSRRSPPATRPSSRRRVVAFVAVPRAGGGRRAHRPCTSQASPRSPPAGRTSPSACWLWAS
jgi:hypothetical protein